MAIFRKKKNDDQRTYSQWKLMRMRFARHKLAKVSLVLLALLYLMAIFADFIAPYDPAAYDRNLVYASPSRIHFGDENGFSLRPFVYKYTVERNMETLMKEYRETTERDYIDFFVEGYEYKLFGMIPTNIHLFGTREGTHIHLFGTTELGKDVFSGVIIGARVSLSIGLVGIALSLVLGVMLGGVAGFFGGVVDEVIQRFIEVLKSIPSLPLWMALSAAIPAGWSVTQRYFAITVILSLMGWTDMARVVRGKFMSLRGEDYVTAAKLGGVKEMTIIRTHLIPAFLSYIVTSATLSLPGMILGETSMSFLGLGMRSPAVSWGVLMEEGQNVFALEMAPWLLIPGLFVIVTVLLFNFLGDGLRDAADPYS